MDFPLGTILIRYYSDQWGPFVFDFSDAIPDGETITACNIRSFFGKVRFSDHINDFTESTTNLVDSSQVENNTVKVRLQYPGELLKGNHSLVFEVTTASGGKHSFFFYKVVVE